MREIAQLLSASDLGEISFDAGKGQRITLKRKPKMMSAAPVSAPVELAEAPVADAAPAMPESEAASEAVLVASPCVGVFHAAKEAVEVGSVTQAKQLIGLVESLKVPNEIYAPIAGVVAQIWVSDGQGVEWGQPLFEIQPGPAPHSESA